jgi:hypothetical protein
MLRPPSSPVPFLSVPQSHWAARMDSAAVSTTRVTLLRVLATCLGDRSLYNSLGRPNPPPEVQHPPSPFAVAKLLVEGDVRLVDCISEVASPSSRDRRRGLNGKEMRHLARALLTVCELYPSVALDPSPPSSAWGADHHEVGSVAGGEGSDNNNDLFETEGGVSDNFSDGDDRAASSSFPPVSGGMPEEKGPRPLLTPLQLIKHLMKLEVSQTRALPLLFRRNSLTTALLRVYMDTPPMAAYREQVLQPALDSLCHKFKTHEVCLHHPLWVRSRCAARCAGPKEWGHCTPLSTSPHFTPTSALP